MYVKLFPKNMTINGLKFKIGRNIDPNPFYLYTNSPGGIYFNSLENMMKNRSFINFEPTIAFLYLDKDIPIIETCNQFNSPEINIFKLMSLNNFFQRMSEYNQLKFVKNNPYSIEYIDNPSEYIKLAVVNVAGETIKYIKDPSEDVQIDAVRNYGLSIRYINDPSEDVQVEAIKNNGNSIYSIENPCEKALELSKIKLF